MGKIYDDWERLVQAVLHREQLRELGLQHSRSTSQSSILSDVSSSSSSASFWSQPLFAQLHKHDFSNKEKSKLVLLQDCSFSCTLEDLLSAPAELLSGRKGTHGGAAFNVTLFGTIPILVRSLKELKATVSEFEQQMAILSRIRHDNIVGLEAYFYFEDEKYLVYGYCHQQSVDSLLHDKTGGGVRPLHWDTRLRIAIGAARGLVHIHTQSQGKLAHGNMKASNIYLNKEQYGCVSDLCFASTDVRVKRFRNHRPQKLRFLQTHSQASDVYSYGILLLELLTRKSPVHARISNEVVGLDTWVNSLTSDNGTTKIFDEELTSSLEFKKEMIKVLLIGMHCVARKPEVRPMMSDVLTMLEDIGRYRRIDHALNRFVNKERHQIPSSPYKDFSNWLYSKIDRAGPKTAEWMD